MFQIFAFQLAANKKKVKEGRDVMGSEWRAREGKRKKVSERKGRQTEGKEGWKWEKKAKLSSELLIIDEASFKNFIADKF